MTTMQTVQPSYVLGVDISNNNGSVDMKNWKGSGVQYVYAKASEGATFKDGLMVENVTKAKAAGIPIGLYHFARPSKNTPQVEVDNFVAQFKAVSTDLVPVLDVEDTNYTGTTATLVAWVNDFANRFLAATGKTLMIYTGKWYADKYGGLAELSRFKLWTAYYPPTHSSTIAPESYGGWNEYTAWQFTEKGVLIGVAGNVDMNYAVSLEALGYSPVIDGQDQAVKVVKHLQTLYTLTEEVHTREAIHIAADAIRDKFNLKGLV